MIILCLYVDDLLIMDNNKNYISKFKSELMEKFEMTGLEGIHQKGIAYSPKKGMCLRY